MTEQEAYESLISESIAAQKQFVADNSTLDRALRETGVLGEFIAEQTGGSDGQAEELERPSDSGEGERSGGSEPGASDNGASG